MNVLKNYLELTKPKVVLMMLITAIIGMLLASKSLPSLYLVIISMIGIGSVSYTHLRAHETVLDLVCRLLLQPLTKL